MTPNELIAWAEHHGAVDFKLQAVVKKPDEAGVIELNHVRSHVDYDAKTVTLWLEAK